jgi:hypothetical protein
MFTLILNLFLCVFLRGVYYTGLLDPSQRTSIELLVKIMYLEKSK